jgi:predicted CoA-binding protein
MEKTETGIEEKILREYRNVAVVGLSPDPEKPSYGIAKYLAEHGYNIIPVNPNAREILGRKSYPDLSSIPQDVEVVEIFRRPEVVMPIVEEAIKIGARVVWMQEGIVNEEAAAKARDAGLLVVMDKCMFKEHWRMTREQKI